MKQILILIGCCLLTACSPFRLYHPDLEQGNSISETSVQQLKMGMTKAEVQKLMGTPILTNTFENDRLNYVYVFHPHRGTAVETRVTLVFKQDKLVHIDQNPG